MIEEGVVVCYADCGRCRTMMAFDPDTVPSVTIHAATLCCLRPDGNQVVPGEAGTYRVPLCPPCVLVFRFPQPRPIVELFPYARLEALTCLT